MDVELAFSGAVDALVRIEHEAEWFIAVVVEDALANDGLLREASQDTLRLPVVIHGLQLTDGALFQVRQQMSKHITGTVIAASRRIDQLIVCL